MLYSIVLTIVVQGLNMDLEDSRREYDFGHLSRASLEDSPFDQFQKWMRDAIDAGIKDPTAMCIATVGQDGNPSQRIVLLKHFDSKGLVFYTNLESRKARELADNTAVSLHFPWMSSFTLSSVLPSKRSFRTLTPQAENPRLLCSRTSPLSPTTLPISSL